MAQKTTASTFRAPITTTKHGLHRITDTPLTGFQARRRKQEKVLRGFATFDTSSRDYTGNEELGVKTREGSSTILKSSKQGGGNTSAKGEDPCTQLAQTTRVIW